MIKNKINFSIIMPTYNRDFCIEKAIDSLLNQTYQNFELIIIDDGSKDNTEELINQKYQKELQNKKIVYKKLNKNQGVCKARNTGLKLAKYDWIGYLDSDNEMLPEFLETFQTEILKNPQNKIFYAKILRSDGSICGRAFNYTSLLQGNYIDMGVFVHNKSLVKKYGKFDTKLKRLVDWDLIIRYTKNNAPIFIEKILLNYNNSDEYERITNCCSCENAKKRIHKKQQKFLQQIFSIKNSYDRRHKVITIFGIKIKIKIKSKKLIARANENFLREIKKKEQENQLLKKFVPKSFLDYVEIHLVEHCNLNCAGCTHFCPLAEEAYLDIETFSKDLNRLADLTNRQVGKIRLMGGEPLLHPELNKFMEKARGFFPNTKISVVTNGILLNKQSQKFWDCCRENDILITISGYPIKLDYDFIKNKAKENNVHLTIPKIQKQSFGTGLWI